MTPIVPDFNTVFGEEVAAAWVSEEFSAALVPQGGVWRLTIARTDGAAAPMSWEELMQVKRDCGFGNFDALEVYPRDEDIFNTANLRHLYLTGTVPFALRANTHTLQPSNPRE